MMPAPVAAEVSEKRGYRDLDPENIWEEWQTFLTSNEWQEFLSSNRQP